MRSNLLIFTEQSKESGKGEKERENHGGRNSLNIYVCTLSHS